MLSIWAMTYSMGFLLILGIKDEIITVNAQQWKPWSPLLGIG